MITLPAAIITLVILFVVVGATSVILNWPIEQNDDQCSKLNNIKYINLYSETDGHTGSIEDPYSLNDFIDNQDNVKDIIYANRKN